MRKLIALVALVAMVMSLTGTALANNPPGDPLPGNGEPACFGARVSHSAAEHGLTPKAKVAVHEGNIAFLNSIDASGWPVWAADYLAYFDANGVSVQSVQKWIRINCSGDPIIGNP